MLYINTIKSSIWEKSRRGTSFCFVKSSWRNFGISKSYDFQNCNDVCNFEFLDVKQKFYLNAAKYYDHMYAFAGNIKTFHEWVELRSADLEILGGELHISLYVTSVEKTSTHVRLNVY